MSSSKSIAESRELVKGMEVLTAQLKAQAAQIQKVSAQLEVSRPAPQTVRTISKAPQPITQPNLAISRHASLHGGCCFASLAPK
jgi:hypothetical protein